MCVRNFENKESDDEILKLDFDTIVKYCEATKDKLDRFKEQQREFTTKAVKVKEEMDQLRCRHANEEIEAQIRAEREASCY